jgi:hypothetical protein
MAALVYELRLRKRHTADQVRERLERDGRPVVVAAELSPAEPRTAETTDRSEVDG